MADDKAKRLAQLKQAHESGYLDEDTYQTAVAALTTSATQEAHVDSGSSAQGAGAQSVGERGVMVHDVGGSIITGDIQGDVYLGTPAQNPAEALAIYCRVLVQSSRQLPLRGVDLGASDLANSQKSLGLTQIYVDLDTQTQVKKEEDKSSRRRPSTPGEETAETRPLSALEAVAANRKLVLTGDPGGGKSTFVNHLAYCLAAHQIQPEDNWLAQIKHWPTAEAAMVPLVVILRDFVRSLPEQLPRQAEAQHLWDFIATRLAAQRLAFAAPPLEEALETGRVVLLLDGLDEVTTRAQRLFVRDAVNAFVERYHAANRVLVTCRILAYQPPAEAGDPDLRLPEAAFPKFELAPFNEEKINRFVETWYAEQARLGQVPASDVAGLTAKLHRAVRRPDLWRLAANPLLLTVMALVHTHKGRLPDARALLYEDTIDVLLWRWEEIKAGGATELPRLRQLLEQVGRNELDLKKVLWQLAYEAQAQTGIDEEQPADIGELALLKGLSRLAGDNLNWASEVVGVMKLRAGLLLERQPGVFTFPHRTFQEYLAGAHLSVQRNFASQATELASLGSVWREVILLAVGKLVYLSGDTADKPLALVNRLCPARIVETETGWLNAWLAGDVLLEMGLQWVRDDEWGQDLLERVRQRLVRLLEGGELSPRERAEASYTLARLGDSRPGVCTLEPDLIAIPAGSFLMGEDKEPVSLEAYAIGRYPVTNAQFRLFIEAGGYDKQSWWTKEGWQYRQQYSWSEPRYWDNERFDQANQPVVGVSWYEAVAYCNWLNQKTGQTYQLPTEAEWERAARHTDGRVYPWGAEKPEPETTNFKETALERPAAVGIFPADTAVCGARDMAGNISEWCQTRWQDEAGKAYQLPYRPDDGREALEGGSQIYRVWKGGYWNGDTRWLRCAARLRDSPRLRNLYIGFRVVMRPHFSPTDGR